MLRRRLRWPVAVVAAVAVAQAAAWLMRPRDGVIDPASVSARSYFTEAQLERARDYREPQLALTAGALLIEVGLLTWLVVRPPRRLERPYRHPLLAAAVAGAALSVAVTAATLPIAAISHQRAANVGLSTQSWGSWTVDIVRSTALSAVFAAVGAGLLIGLVRCFPRRWWLPASAGVVAVGALYLYAAPLVLDPLFNRFEELPEGRVRADVVALAKQAGVDVGEVYEVDASRRTTAANAYVTGLGHSKRVVLYDTLLRDFSPEEVRLVVAHELAHVHYDDVPRGLLFLVLVAPLSMFAVQRLTERLTPARGTAAMLPAVVLSIGVVTFAVTTVSNQLSRRVEARADSFSLDLTRDPAAFVAMERRLALQNVSDPDLPGWVTFLRATHPPTIERIGAGVAFERAGR